jgi:hypothetical protein
MFHVKADGRTATPEDFRRLYALLVEIFLALPGDEC